MSRSNYQRLGNYIELVNVRNRDLAVTNLMGVSIEKVFIKSIANTIGTDLSSYKIVKPRQFAYGPVTSRNGDKITIALYEGTEDCIISQAYESFRIKDENELLPEFLMLWAQRSEFDRYARFMSHGSVRELFSWEEMCNVLLPVPPITEQRRIVSEYQTVERRIRNNEALIQKLEETAQAIYHHTFVEGIDEENLPEGWRKGTLGDFGQSITGKTPSSDNPEDYGDRMMFMTPADFHNYTKYISSTERYLSDIGIERLKNKVLPADSIIVTCIGSDMGKVALCDSACITNQQINGLITEKYSKDYVYYYLRDKKDYLKAIASGSSTMPLLNKSQFDAFQILIPSHDVLVLFYNQLVVINKYISLLSKESLHLRTLLTLLTSKLS